MQQAISVLESRVNGTGNSGAQVQQQGADLINVTSPARPPENVINLVSTTAKLAFRPEPYTGAVGHAVHQRRRHAVETRVGQRRSSTRPPREHERQPRRRPPTRVGAARQPAPAHRDGDGPHVRQHATPGHRHVERDPDVAERDAPRRRRPRTVTASPVNAATLKLFNKLVCKPGPNATTVDDSWKATVGYTEAGDQWDNTDEPDRLLRRERHQVRARPGAVIEGTDVTSVTPAPARTARSGSSTSR